MQEYNSLLEPMELIHEMNRLFLSFLRDRASRGIDCLGLPKPVCALLRTASDAQLDRAASLPRALFRIEFESAAAADAPLTQASSDVIALYSLQSKLLLSARNLSRVNGHLAQTILGLPEGTLMRLQCLVLMELVDLAEHACILASSFDAEPWLWRELLCSEDLLAQRRLRLIALQPRATDLRPQAPPRAVAIR